MVGLGEEPPRRISGAKQGCGTARSSWHPPSPGEGLHPLLAPGPGTRHHQPLSQGFLKSQVGISAAGKGKEAKASVGRGFSGWRLTPPQASLANLRKGNSFKNPTNDPKKAISRSEWFPWIQGCLSKEQELCRGCRDRCRVSRVLPPSWAQVPPGPAQVFVSVPETNNGTCLSPSTESGL